MNVSALRQRARATALRLTMMCVLSGSLLTVQLMSNEALADTPAPAATKHRREMTYLKRQWGVEVMYVRQASAGYMLEFRYKVLDPVKAAPLFDRQTKPVLFHEESGAQLIVPTPPTTGALRNSNPPLVGHTYWMFFANPGKYVKSGQHVTVVIGDFRAEGVEVL